MSRRTRDYSSGYHHGSYHRVYSEGTSFGVRVLASIITLGITASVGLCAERIGDSWSQRGDKAEYDEDGEKAANEYTSMLLNGRKVTVLVLDSNNGSARDVKKVESVQDFEELANASKPGGQPSDELGFSPFRYDLEWDGYAGKNNSSAPKKHCIEAEIPSGANAVAAWQVRGNRATIAIVEEEGEDPKVELCQYGKWDTPDHNEVAVVALKPGQIR